MRLFGLKAFAMTLSIVAIALALFAAGGVLGEEKKVSGTKHDIATPGNPSCVSCHLQKDPDGQALWAVQPNAAGPFSGTKPLCFSCHDGTVTARGSTLVFDPSRPEHPSAALQGQGCDRCHDPHNTGYGNFIKVPGDASFCRSCHFRAGPTDHPVDIDALAAGIRPQDTHWDPAQGDFSGTRLWNEAGTGPGSTIKCLTCHSPHGGQPNTDINTFAFSPADNSYLPLCQSCHRRGGGN